MRRFALVAGALFLMACRPPAAVPAPLDLQVQDAVLVQGPGMAPRPGDAPHRPVFSARVKPVGALPAGTAFWGMLLAPSETEVWRTRGGEGAVEVRAEAEASGWRRLHAALPPRAVGSAPQVGLELRQGGQVLLRKVVVVEGQFLPGSPTRKRGED